MKLANKLKDNKGLSLDCFGGTLAMTSSSPAMTSSSPILRYREYVEQVRAHEAKRLGYTVVGAMDQSDYALGIIPDSILNVYLNNIGSPYDMPSSFHHHA